MQLRTCQGESEQAAGSGLAAEATAGATPSGPRLSLITCRHAVFNRRDLDGHVQPQSGKLTSHRHSTQREGKRKGGKREEGGTFLGSGSCKVRTSGKARSRGWEDAIGFFLRPRSGPSRPQAPFSPPPGSATREGKGDSFTSFQRVPGKVSGETFVVSDWPDPSHMRAPNQSWQPEQGTVLGHVPPPGVGTRDSEGGESAQGEVRELAPKRGSA